MLLIEHVPTIATTPLAICMNSLSITRTKRNWAIAMLLLWVFAIANACVFEPLSIGVQVAASDGSMIIGESDSTRSSMVNTDHTSSSASHDIGSEESDVGCLDVARFGPNSVIDIQADAEFDRSDALPAAVTQWAVATPIDLVQRPIDELRPLVTAIPLRVRYVRLTL